MPQGVEKITFTDPDVFNINNFVAANRAVDPPNNWIIKANRAVELKAVYYPDTPQTLYNTAKWIIQPKTGKIYSIDDRRDKTGDIGFLSMEPKFCGPQEFIIEAFTDQPTNQYPQQLTFRGYAPRKIVKATWSKTNGGEGIEGSIKYGDVVYLNVQTEGLNGSRLAVEVYDKTYAWGDNMVTSETVKCEEGEINIGFRNTFTWKSRWQVGEDDFYIKVKYGAEYVKDNHDDDIHARFLTIENDISSREVASSTTERPATVGQTQVNFERYELCRFEKITITDDSQDVVLFDQKSLGIDVEEGKKEFQVSETIHFDVDKSNIRDDAKPILEGIARLLIDNPRIPITLGAHCDSRADNDYNARLSLDRANSSKSHLVGLGVNGDLITTFGYGEERPLIPDPTDGTELTEEEHQLNRRVTIEFMIFGADAESIIFEVISGDTEFPKPITFQIDEFNTDQCIRRGMRNEDHRMEVPIKILTVDNNATNADTKQGSNFTSEVFSDMSRIGITPIKYIWPISSPQNQFQYHIHSCRYYAYPDKPTLLGNIYPDIKWKLEFFLNLSNELSVRWQNQSPAQHRELQQKAGRIGAENRWQQKDTSFGFEIEAKWNKSGEDSYARTQSLKVEFERKIKKLYDMFSSIGNIASGITNKTKGNIRNMGFRGVPAVFSVTPPNLSLTGNWFLKRAQESDKAIKEIGTQIEIEFKASPLIGLEITIDLIGAAIGVAAGAISGGSASTKAVELWQTFDDALNEGKGIGGEEAGADVKADVYVDLVLSGEISSEIGFSFNTVGDPNPGVKLELASKIGIELKAGILIEGEIRAWVVKANAYFKATASGKASITFGHGVEYDDKGLFYIPQLGFDGLDVEYEVSAAAGLSIEKDIVEGAPEVDWDNSWTILKDEYKELVPKFDVVKSLAELTGFDPKIPIMRNDS
ncbi:OmpA family protein [Aquimarina sp. MAR_2010_214]|uniref:OmpA family protein n=1 Tax=Aquimarina sp. MAR_2010_214 TaxID=1250026 RepID=UPI000C7002ED|nr:OmpA family protein [Aquimarina sp. MAR_2010_214]PKV50747.1 OmpA family protein [Aquimarina sp. MAR_2010_214]